MESISREGCKLVLNEVYEGDIGGFIARSDAFFAIMPNPEAERELSEFSPLYEVREPKEYRTTELRPDSAASPLT